MNDGSGLSISILKTRAQPDVRGDARRAEAENLLVVFIQNVLNAPENAQIIGDFVRGRHVHNGVVIELHSG